MADCLVVEVDERLRALVDGCPVGATSAAERDWLTVWLMDSGKDVLSACLIAWVSGHLQNRLGGCLIG